MTIRLTSVSAFEKVLEKLKQDPLYSETANGMFMKYSVPVITEGLSKGGDEWYLDVDWKYDYRIGNVTILLRFHRRSSIPTDEEYLSEKED